MCAQRVLKRKCQTGREASVFASTTAGGATMGNTANLFVVRERSDWLLKQPRQAEVCTGNRIHRATQPCLDQQFPHNNGTSIHTRVGGCTTSMERVEGLCDAEEQWASRAV